MKKILITGGTGLIGRQLIAKLEKQYAFVVISRQPDRARRLLGDAHEYKTIDDLTDIENIHAVINLAGEPIADRRWTETQKLHICESRWRITTHLVELINDAVKKPSVMLSGSAIGYYGRQGDKPINEDYTDCYDEFTHQVCKRWEDLALQAQTRVCVLRTGVVLDEDGGALAKMLMPFRIGLGGPIGTGKQYLSWIHIEDTIKGVVFLLENEKCVGPYNLTSPNPNTNAFFSLKLAKRLDRPCLLRMPAFAIRALMGESSDLVLYGQKVLPERLMSAGFDFSYPTLEQALDALDI